MPATMPPNCTPEAAVSGAHVVLPAVLVALLAVSVQAAPAPLPASCDAAVIMLRHHGAVNFTHGGGQPKNTPMYYYPDRDYLYLFRMGGVGDAVNIGWLDCKKPIPAQIKANRKMLNLFR